MAAPPPDRSVGSDLGNGFFLRPVVVYAGAGRGPLPGVPRGGDLFGDEPLAERRFAMVFAALDGCFAPLGTGNCHDFASNLEDFEKNIGNCKKTLFIRRKMG